METLGLILSVVGSAVAATWVLRSKLSDLEAAFKVHVQHDEDSFTELDKRVIKLETRRKRV